MMAITTKKVVAQPIKRTTTVTIKYDVGFGNWLSIRGEGAHLQWNKGVNLKNIRSDEWVWETEQPFEACEFKILINDKIYETGHNHFITSGSTVTYTPSFQV
jgi:hypothetical protein